MKEKTRFLRKQMSGADANFVPIIFTRLFFCSHETLQLSIYVKYASAINMHQLTCTCINFNKNHCFYGKEWLK